MAVSTTTIPTIVPGITKLGEAVGSANQTIERVNALSAVSNTNEASIGSLPSLETTNKTNLVAAINEMVEIFRNGFLVQSITGNTLDLATTSKTNLVAAINEINDNVGDLSGLSTSTKINVVSAINESISQSQSIGDPVDLVTQNKNTLVEAINEVSYTLGSIRNLNTGQSDVISSMNVAYDRIGDLAFLETVDKTSLVAAINEIQDISDMFLRRDGANRPSSNIDWNQKLIRNLGAGVNESDAVTVGQVQTLAKSGNLSTLETVDKTTLVAAINEIIGDIGGLSNLDTTNRTSLVAAINEIIVESDYSSKQDKVEDVSTLPIGKDIATNAARTISFFSTPSSSPSFSVSRLAGEDGSVDFINAGAGFFNFGFTGNQVMRIRPDSVSPLQVKVSGDWENVPTVGTLLEKIGGTMTGAINFNITPSSNMLVFDLQNGYGLFSDNEGTNGATSRLWFDKVGTGGEMTFGPKDSGDRLENFTVRANTSRFEGDIIATGDIEGLSDARVKSELRNIVEPLEKVLRMHGLHYEMHGEQKTGVIAQELVEVAPELVRVPEDGGLMSVNYSGIIPYLIEAIKVLSAEIDELKAAR